MFLERMVALKTVCLRRLGGDRDGELRCGRFLDNDKVTVERIVESWSDLTGPAAAGRHVLAIQDTTEVVFPTTADRRRGLGQVKKGNVHGLSVHAMIGVDADTGACLGLIGGEVWSRAGAVAIPARKRAFADRESARWLRTAKRAETVLASAAMATVVDDREGDVYPKWAAARRAGFHLLSRAQADRRLAEGGRLFAAAAAFPEVATVALQVPSRGPGQAGRTARLGLRHGEVEICRPVHGCDPGLAKTVKLRLIEVREIDPPDTVEPLLWRLLTTHEIDTPADAWRIVGWYKARWTIEQLFRVMKTQGLRLEDSQVATAERLVKLAAIAAKAACVDMQLTQARDGADAQPASNVFTAEEIATLTVLTPTLEGNTQKQKNPHPPGSLAWAGWTVARLGGWNCYYGKPGPITMRRGREQFQAIHKGFLLGSEAV